MAEEPPSILDALPASIPEPIKLSALRVLKTVIFGAADYGAAWVERFTSEVRDGTRARSSLSAALAQQAADEVRQRPELVDRAVAAWLPRAMRKQENREAIAEQAIEELSHVGPVKPSAGETTSRWIERFSTLSEDVDDDEMRRMWARILAGEISNPGAFSLTTLRVLSELSAADAQRFERVLESCACDGNIIFHQEFKEHPRFDDLLALAGAGLIAYPDTAVGQQFEFDDDGTCDLQLRGFLLKVRGQPSGRPFVSTIPLTRAGNEIAAVLPVMTDFRTAEALCDRLRPYAKTADLYEQRSGEEVFVKSILTTVTPEVPSAGAEAK